MLIGAHVRSVSVLASIDLPSNIDGMHSQWTLIGVPQVSITNVALYVFACCSSPVTTRRIRMSGSQGSDTITYYMYQGRRRHERADLELYALEQPCPQPAGRPAFTSETLFRTIIRDKSDKLETVNGSQETGVCSFKLWAISPLNSSGPRPICI